MEHHSISLELENLAATYRSLASSVVDTRVIENEYGLLALSSTLHPLANFAILKDPNNADKILELIGEQRGIHVYSVGEDPIQTRFNLRPGYSLRLMRHTAEAIPTSKFEIRFAGSMQEREEIANFMVDQFFKRSSRQSQQLVAAATANGEGLNLVGFRTGFLGRLAAAAMLVPTERTLGLYNLCLAPSLRGKGMGTQILNAILMHGRELEKTVLLQCEGKLVPWYQRNGFSSSGVLKVWTLSS